VLITDTDGFAKKYGVTGFLWNRRATFLIDRQGKIAFSWYKVDVQDHVKEVLQKLKDLAL
jgi:peroxiredoxin